MTGRRSDGTAFVVFALAIWIPTGLFTVTLLPPSYSWPLVTLFGVGTFILSYYLTTETRLSHWWCLKVALVFLLLAMATTGGLQAIDPPLFEPYWLVQFVYRLVPLLAALALVAGYVLSVENVREGLPTIDDA